MVVMVYDLGGGTFDATLLRLTPGDFRTLATDGDVQLGGHDWDGRLVDHAAEEFRKAHGRDPREDPAALARLYDAVVEAKHTLSARTHTIVRVECAGQTCDVPITREQFEEMSANLLERTAYTSRQLLSAGGLSWKDVSRILLVGGSTRMPMVGRMLERLTGLVPDRTVNPDEAVARGAALYAHYLLSSPGSGGPGPTFEVTNVNAHSLGVEGIDPTTLRKVNVVLVPRNTPLPARRSEKFTTKTEGQRSIAIQILEGESTIPDDCTAVGRTVIHDLPPGLPKGWPVEVTFEYGTNGRLAVAAVVPGTDRSVTLELERDVGLSREGISRLKEAVHARAGFDTFEAMIDEVLEMDGADEDDPPAAREESSGWNLSRRATDPAALPKGTVPFSSDENRDSPRLDFAPILVSSPVHVTAPRAGGCGCCRSDTDRPGDPTGYRTRRSHCPRYRPQSRSACLRPSRKLHRVPRSRSAARDANRSGSLD
jgi:molecular chaperone DnaK